MGNFIIGAVSASGGPNRCIPSFGSVGALLPDICTTKGTTCCHTPIISSSIYSASTGSSAWFANPFLISRGIEEPYYFIKHPIATEFTGCATGPVYAADYYGNLISFTTPDGADKQFPGSPSSFTFYVNYGCTIYIDFLFTVPLWLGYYCRDWLSLRLTGLNPPNLGALTGSWYKNCPNGLFNGVYCDDSTFTCEQNAARLAAGQITVPYACEGVGATSCCCATGAYAADLNPYSVYGDMKSYVCDSGPYCCENISACCNGKDLPPNCTGGSSPCTLDDPIICDCGTDTCSFEQSVCSARPFYSPGSYITIAASYQYTCDNLNGAEIQVILDTLKSVNGAPGSYYIWDIDGNYDPYGDYSAGYNLYPGSWGYMTVECLGCSGCPEQAYCE
jgi:hypothetical protein